MKQTLSIIADLSSLVLVGIIGYGIIYAIRTHGLSLIGL